MSGDVPAGFEPLDTAGGFLDHVGPVYVRTDDDGHPTLGLRLEDRHLNVAGTAHGGLLSTLADSALGRAIHASGDDDGRPATVSLTTDYLGPAEAGDWVEASTKVERLGSRLAFADCSLTVEGREVVRARAVFAILG